MWPNKQIMALAAARWDANTCAASPLLHTYLRPIFGSYVSCKKMNIVTNTDKKIVHFIVRIWLLLGYAFVGHGLYRAFSEGYVITKSGRAYLTNDPVMFWLIVSLQIVLILGFTFYFFRKPDLEAMGKD
jgi:hypothetical protein